MKKMIWYPVFVFFFAITGYTDTAEIVKAYGNIPLAFTLNQGQTDPQVKFTTAGNGCTMFFAPTGTTFLLNRETAQSVARRTAKKAAGSPEDMTSGRDTEREYESLAVKTVFVGANPSPEVVGEDRLSWNNNYFIGSDPSKWQTDVPNYGKIRLKEVYSGIDLVYYGNKNRLKYDFVVKPGEDPSKVVLRYDLGVNGGNALSINSNHELAIRTTLGDIVERKPYCYQKIGGKEIEISIDYRIIDASSNIFGFEIGEFDTGSDLYIDPELSYSTFLGSYIDDYGYGIAVDNSGNTYVTGNAGSSIFPETSGTNFFTSNKVNDVFVKKLNKGGDTLLYATFLGGKEVDDGYGIAVDSYGNAYVTGRTYSPDYPVKNGAYDKSWNGYSDVFVTKLNAIGNTLIYSTFIGSYEPEYGYGIAVDSSGNAYVTGSTDSNTYPVTSGAFDTSFNSFSWDAFVTKLSAGGDALIYSTFLGGNSWDYGYAIAVDGSGNAYVTGSTISSNYPVTSGAFDTSFSGAEAFVTKLNTSGTALIYSTFLGESSSDWQHSGAFGNGIVIDRFGNAYVTGSTI